MQKSKIQIPVVDELKINSADYFRKALIKPTGFREYDVRWLIEKELNYQGAVVLGAAYGTLMQTDYDIKDIIVGHDYRYYSQNLKNAFVVGLMSSGMDVLDIGLGASPSLYFAQHHYDIKGAAMITASHNENGWTGIKLGFGLSKTLGPEGITRYKEIVYEGKFIEEKGSYSADSSVHDIYIRDLIERANTGRKLKLVIATGNGTGGLYTPEVMRGAGHEVIEQHVDLDWNFPNFNPNPEDIMFLKDIGDRVRKEKADMGIGIDGDADRVGIVDNNGNLIYSDKIGLLLARNIAVDHPGSTFVVDVKSTGLFKVDDVLKENKCETIYWKTGHSYLRAKVQELDAIAGFEKSGHFFFNKPLGMAYDDGTLSALHFCNFLSNQEKSVSQLLDELPLSFQTPTMAPYCDDNEKYKVVYEITDDFLKEMDEKKSVAGVEIEEIITVNGVRVHYKDKSWGLVRASSNKPSLVVVAESFTTKKRMYDIIEDITHRLNSTGKVGKWDQYLPMFKEDEK